MDWEWQTFLTARNLKDNRVVSSTHPSAGFQEQIAGTGRMAPSDKVVEDMDRKVSAQTE